MRAYGQWFGILELTWSVFVVSRETSDRGVKQRVDMDLRTVCHGESAFVSVKCEEQVCAAQQDGFGALLANERHADRKHQCPLICVRYTRRCHSDIGIVYGVQIAALR